MTVSIELPNNQEAERTTLGSVLLRPDAIHEINDWLEQSMFYQERHAIIYAAMQACAAARIPPDIRLVMNELRKRQQLDKVGGLEYLSSLTDSVPTSLRVAYYAKIVVDTAGFRKLIKAGSKIAAIGYEESEGDLIAAQAKAEKELLGATQVKSEEGLQHVGITINELYTDYDQSETSAIPSGFRDYDELTGGYQQGDLVILGARPSVGKTSKALCDAFNVARAGYRVDFFSMEMSKKQNIQRLISMGTGIPLERYRDKKLTEDDIRVSFGYMGDVINQLPLYFDDTPSLDIRTLRSRALRNAMKYGTPGLIVVDYLQLASDKAYKDRLQEVSSVSRQLKALARELKCSVLALAQLSRAVEGRNTKVPVLSDLRECVSGDTQVINADTGIPVCIKDIASGMSIMGVSHDQKIAPYTVRDVWSNGMRPVYRFATSTGKSIVLTTQHPLMTATGWKNAGELNIGDTIATAMRFPEMNIDPETNADLCRFLGYMIGNGTFLKGGAIGLIVSDEVILDDVRSILQCHFPKVTLREKKRTATYIDVDFVQIYKNGYGRPHGNELREWFRDLSIFGARDYQKHIPSYVFQSGIKGVAAFLSGYLSTDGCVKRSNNNWRIHFDTTSVQLAHDVQLLLSYIGVVSSISNGYMSKKAKHPIYRITLSSFHVNLLRFADAVCVIGKKGQRINEMRGVVQSKGTTSGAFGLPVEVSRYLASISEWRDQGKSMRRDICLDWSNRLSDDTLRIFADSDLLWEKIVAIEYLGYQEVYDISVPGCANFIGNGIVSHNCGQIEQDADIVAFIYREEMHNKDTDKKGIAELHIAKSRNGALGVIPMRFDGTLTKFSDLTYRSMDGY